MTRTFHLTVAYNGTHYAGWQIQPGLRTIQGELERALGGLVKSSKDSPKTLRVLGSGRTDAGVHATGQVARCVLPSWNAGTAALQRAINSQLPDDILVHHTRETVATFHPIGDSVSKCYRYFIQAGGDRHPFSHTLTHRVKKEIDTDVLEAAAQVFLGEHDFAAMQSAGAPRATTIRSLSVSKWTQVSNPFFTWPHSSNAAQASPIEAATGFWMYEVAGNGFLYNMVRNLVGTMLEVAKGQHELAWITRVMQSGDRSLAGPTAPASGLFLHQVDYPQDIFNAPDTSK